MAEETTDKTMNEPTIPAPVVEDSPVIPNKDADFLQPEPQADSPAPPLMNIHADLDTVDVAVTSQTSSTIRNNLTKYKPSQAALPPPVVASIGPRTATPTRTTNGNSDLQQHIPAKAALHGAPARRYLNEKVTGVLLEGMKRLAAEQ